MGRFKVGDRVTGSDNIGHFKDAPGVITEVDEKNLLTNLKYRVRFDGMPLNIKGFWVLNQSVRPLQEQTITLDASAFNAEQNDVEITYNGTVFRVHLSKVEPVWAEPVKVDPFGRVDRGAHYYFFDDLGRVGHLREARDCTDDGLYAVANYSTDENLMKQRAFHETLSRLLWRFAQQNDTPRPCPGGQYIIKHSNVDGWGVVYVACSVFGAPTFTDETIARRAIDEIIKPFCAAHPEWDMK